MRITDKILHNNFIYNLAYASERLYESETKVLTNKRLNKPSDSPVDVMTDLAIRTKLDEITQFQRNISRSQTLLQNTESITSQMQEIFQRVNTLTIQGASDSYGPTDKLSISYEVNQLLEQVYSYANNRSESIYTFSGTYSDTAPYIAIRNSDGEIESVKSAGSSGDIITTIGENINMKVNINGEDLFESGENLFNVLIDIRDSLRANDSDSLRNDIGKLETASEKIINIQAVIGSRLNRITAADSRAENDTISFTEFLSNTEDIDASEAIMDYQLQLLTLQSSLQAGSRLIQPKLSDFLS
ncbi:flagellar hook-associated protein FlgL [bacterium]|nr:flagellar hook-associated protein FlgL [bacterium]